MSPALSAQLDAVIDAANRANVTTYAVDANGLRTRSGDRRRSRRRWTASPRIGFGQLATGSDRTEQPLTMAFERVEDTLRLDSRTGLARLAEDTGGFLVEQSNDLSSAFRRIDEDNQFHYLLTYSPSNTTFDGKFRAIRVKVRRPSAAGLRAGAATAPSATARRRTRPASKPRRWRCSTAAAAERVPGTRRAASAFPIRRGRA